MNSDNPYGPPRREGEDATRDWPAQQRAHGGVPPGYPGPPPQHPPYPPYPPYPPHPQAAPGGPPPGWYPPQGPPAPSITVQPRPKGRRRGLLIAGTLLAVIVLAAGAVAAYQFTAGRGEDSATGPANTWPPPSSSKAPSSTPATPSPAAAANIDPAALRGLLLPAPEINEMFATTGMVPGKVATQLSTGGRATPLECIGTFSPIHHLSYAGKGSTGMAGQSVSTEPKPTYWAIQGVVSFSDPEMATRYLEMEVSTWRSCENQQITIDFGNNDINRADIGTPTFADDVLSLVFTPQVSAGSPPVTCERALTARRNVVVDVRACTPTNALVGKTLVAAIAAKL